MTTVQRTRRADAQRNYDRIVAAARVAIAEHGSDIVLEDIAREAGVGIGTLYRHFPTRQALFEATFLDEALELRDRAEELADDPSPYDALVTWLRQHLDFSAHGHAMGAAVMNLKHTEGSDMQRVFSEMREVGNTLLRRAQDVGEIRPDVDLSDITRLVHGIVLINERAPDPERAERMFDVVIAGIRAPGKG
jgi:AcrR family transcriptional regulator